MRRRALWVPALLSALALLTVVGGVAVGHFYWTGLRFSMGRMDTTMSQARENQRGLLDQIRRTQEELAAQQQRLQAEAEALDRKTESLAVLRRQLILEQEALARARAVWEKQAATREELGLRLAGSTRLVAAAAEKWSKDADPAVVQGMLAAVEVLLEEVDAASLREELSSVQERFAALELADRAHLAARLGALRARVVRLMPVRRPPGEPRVAVRALSTQLEAARFALDRGDVKLYRRALETAEFWLNSFFDTRSAALRDILLEISELKDQPLEPDLGAIDAELARLREVFEAPQAGWDSPPVETVLGSGDAGVRAKDRSPLSSASP